MGGMTGSLLLLLLWAGVSVSAMVDLQKRIYFDHVCHDDERFYHVKLNIQKQDGRTTFCGGSLISDEWILTAAHCWNPKLFRTITAELRVHPRGNEVTEQINVNNIKPHLTADIMLLRLTTPRPGFEIIKLPYCDRHPTPRNKMVQIAGHAAITTGAGGTRINDEVRDLHCANIKAIDCLQPNPTPHGHMFCGETTDVNNRVGVCHGDSGGGVVYKNRLYGVIVEGHPTHVCAGPDIYIDVCQYIEWITLNTNIVPPRNLVDMLKDNIQG